MNHKLISVFSGACIISLGLFVVSQPEMPKHIVLAYSSEEQDISEFNSIEESKLFSDPKDWARTINEFSVSIGSPLKDKYGDFIVQLGKKYNVHPYFIVAIGFADSSLGKNLTTKYNIGNNGNTDSCPTCRSYKSWEEGLEAIAQTTSNKYLGHYKYIYQFSRGGQNKYNEFKKGNKYYASSMTNWNNNTSSAMSKMLGTEQNDKLCVRLECYKE